MAVFVLLFIGAFLAIKVVQYKTNKAHLLSLYAKGNTITFGRKGCGKDLLFNYVINNRSKSCYSNIQFNEKRCTVAPLSMLSVEPNTYEQFIAGKVQQIQRNTEREGRDYYLSDSGIYLPSQYNSLLDKQYKSMPIYFALSRHLYGSNVHINTQALSRPWNKVREQADRFIQAVSTWSICGLVFVTRWRTYDKYESAEHELRAYRAGAFSSKERKARKEEHRALYGDIVEGYVIQFRHNIKYDTRAFATILFGDRWSDERGSGKAGRAAHTKREHKPKNERCSRVPSQKHRAPKEQ